MKNLFLIALFLGVTASAHGEPPATCSLKLAQSPAVRGIKLGMKLDDVLALFPGSREEEPVKVHLSNNRSFPRYGVVNFGITPGQYPTREQFAGTEALYFTFVDDKLVEYYVGYNWPTWPKIDDFVDKFAEALSLPRAQNWTGDTPSQRALVCDGFRIDAITRDGRGALKLRTGDEPSKIQRDRREAAEAQARRDFRP